MSSLSSSALATEKLLRARVHTAASFDNIIAEVLSDALIRLINARFIIRRPIGFSCLQSERCVNIVQGRSAPINRLPELLHSTNESGARKIS